MVRYFLTCLLAALIALQSVVAIADAYELHQSGTEYLELNHSQQSADAKNDNQLVKQSPDKPGQLQYDYHHCCHGHVSMIPFDSSSHFANFSETRLVDYQANLTSFIPTSLYRPPIA
jgi:hypothetical protein